MEIPLPKLKAILLYFTNYEGQRFLGKVKLMKLFYFMDFMHVKKYATPITFDHYINMEHGPVPSFIKNLIDSANDDLNESTLADIISFEYPLGMNSIHKIISVRPFTNKDRDYLSETEFEIIKRVCLKYGNMNKKAIEEASHLESPWKETHFLDTIPYNLAADDDDCEVSKEDINLSLSLR